LRARTSPRGRKLHGVARWNSIPPIPKRCSAWANSARERGAHDEAIRIFETAIRHHPHDALMHNGLGLALGLAGDDEGAQREYERALAEPDYPPDVHANLARLLHRQQDYPGAARNYAAYIARTVDAPADVWWALGLCQRKLGDLPAAERSYREALRRTPDNADVKHELCMVLIELGEAAEAAGMLTELVASGSRIRYLRATLGSARQLVCDWTDWDANLQALHERIASVDATTTRRANRRSFRSPRSRCPLSPRSSWQLAGGSPRRFPACRCRRRPRAAWLRRAGCGSATCRRICARTRSHS
jgi:tetratricopeptide (TPR) repeat protein